VICKKCDIIKRYIKEGFSKSEATELADEFIKGIEEYEGKGEGCVTRKISILKDEHKDWPRDKVVAVALKMCGESREK
jgi:polyhydroxyalkanoate synthesis regulator phasin